MDVKDATVEIEKVDDECVKYSPKKCSENLSLNKAGVERYVNSLVEDSISQSVDNVARKRVLFVGIVALDYITFVEEYPNEDEEVYAEEYYLSRGGNAANSATVSGLLGGQAEFFGIMVKNRDFDFIKDDFKQSNVHSENVVVLDPSNHKPPVTFIWVSKKTGSRTILADFKNLTELKGNDFQRLDLTNYKWVHFEGRENVSDIIQMIEAIEIFNEGKEQADKVRVSVEIEPPRSLRPKLQALFDKADYLFVSKDYSQAEGYTSMEEAAEGLLSLCKDDATVICPWGADGASAKVAGEKVVTSHSYPPPHLIDTIGAGDTFIAGTVFSLSNGQSLEIAIGFGCRMAGAKCGMRGFAGLKGFQKHFP